jgi:hypothetical protein
MEDAPKDGNNENHNQNKNENMEGNENYNINNNENENEHPPIAAGGESYNNNLYQNKNEENSNQEKEKNQDEKNENFNNESINGENPLSAEKSNSNLNQNQNKNLNQNQNQNHNQNLNKNNKTQMGGGSNDDETGEEDNEDLFDGEYEEFEDKSFYGDPEYEPQTNEDFSTLVVNRRTELFKVIIVRTKREFEAPIIFNDKAPGEEGNGSNFEFKAIKASEFPCGERAVIEMGFQTNNESYEKSYQVPRMNVQNAITTVEKGLGDIIDKLTARVNSNLNDPAKMSSMELFLLKVRSRMEEALQSNETIDIFQNDFDLSRVLQSENTAEKKAPENETEIRSFRDNILAGQKSKKEKSVNYIRLVKTDEVYVAHSLIRNLSFEERAKINGIPYQSQILFWDFVDPEINSQVFSLEIPMEITCFEFNPTNENQIVCGLISGQLIIYELKDLTGILKGNYLGENAKKCKIKFNKKILIKIF